MKVRNNPTKLIIQQSTKDYSLFVPSATNRARIVDGEFTPRNDLIKSMKEHGFLEHCPIICIQKDDRLEIFDGHNRFVAAKFLGLEIHYLAYPNDSKMDIACFNKCVKAWAAKDYINAWASQGMDDYIEVVKFSEATGIGDFLSACLFGGQTVAHNIGESVKNGTFRIKDRVTPYVIADVAFAIKAVKPKVVKKNLILALAKCAVIPEFDMSELKQRVIKNPSLLEEKRSVDDYLMMLEKIYNFARKGQMYPLCIRVKEVMRDRDAAKNKRALRVTREVSLSRH
jgi:predicted lipoprotein with Yx(FWY)xxD motif